jgi:hypothetical protein
VVPLRWQATPRSARPEMRTKFSQVRSYR